MKALIIFYCRPREIQMKCPWIRVFHFRKRGKDCLSSSISSADTFKSKDRGVTLFISGGKSWVSTTLDDEEESQ
jgi:hypothetical protein